MKFFESYDPELRRRQKAYLEKQEEKYRRADELIFSYGNASVLYYKEAKMAISEESFKDYLSALREYGDNKIADHFEAQGFEKSKGAIPYIRYVNEKQDIGMEEFIKEKLGEKLYNEYKSLL